MTESVPPLLPARIRLLGVPIDAITINEAVTLLQHLLSTTAQHHVTTPNNEMLVAAGRNNTFRKILQHSSLNLPDSTGLLLGAWWTGQHLPERVTGVDTMVRLCRELPQSYPVFLLGAGPGIAAKAARQLQQWNPDICIAGTDDSPPTPAAAAGIIARIQQSRPALLLVAYGAPQQDEWIDRYLALLPSVRVAIGVGGTLDFLAGTKKRAPVWMQRSGLEWLFRFAQEPSRWKRMWNAVVLFPLLIIRYGKNTPPSG